MYPRLRPAESRSKPSHSLPGLVCSRGPAFTPLPSPILPKPRKQGKKEKEKKPKQHRTEHPRQRMVAWPRLFLSPATPPAQLHHHCLPQAMAHWLTSQVHLLLACPHPSRLALEMAKMRRVTQQAPLDIDGSRTSLTRTPHARRSASLGLIAHHRKDEEPVGWRQEE